MLLGPDGLASRPLPPPAPPPRPPAKQPAPSASQPTHPPPAPTASVKALQPQERNAILAKAAAYGATAPSVTVKDKTTAAVTPIVTAAKRERDAAQQRLDADKANEKATQSQLNTLYEYMDSHGAHPVMVQHAQSLQKELVQEQRQQSSDHHRVLAAKAKEAAGNVVLYGQQARSDQQAAKTSTQQVNTSSANLTKTLPKDVPFKPGGTLTQAQIDALNDKQRAAYFSYLNARTQANNDQAKVFADNAAINENYAQLQLYASFPKNYGHIAADGVDAVNAALKPLGLKMTAPAAIDPAKAKANLDVASRNSKVVDAYFKYTTAAIPAQEASNKVQAAQQQVDEIQKQVDGLRVCLPKTAPLMQQLDAAKQTLAQATRAATLPQLKLNAAGAYLGKLQGDQNLQQARSALTAANEAYDKWRAGNPGLDAPGNKYELAVNRAQQQVNDAAQQAGIADAQFKAAYAQFYASEQDARVAAAGQKVASERVCTANYADSPEAAWSAAKAQAKAAHEVADSLTADANKLTANYQLATAKSTVAADRQALVDLKSSSQQWTRANPYAPAAANPNAPHLAQVQADLAAAQRNLTSAQQLASQAQYQVELARFDLSLPENLQDPKTDADKQALKQAEYQFEVKHEFQAGPINGQQAINQVQSDLNSEQQYLDSRGLVEQAATSISSLWGHKRSNVESYLQDTLGKVEDVQKEYKSGQLTQDQYQADLKGILGDYGQTYLTMTADERNSDKGWQTADNIVRTGVATVTAIGVTVATGGNVAVGAAAGFGMYQLYDSAENDVTMAEGGNVMNDSHISLFTLAGAAIDGKANAQMADRAGLDAGVDAVSSLAAAGGTVAGQLAGSVVGGWLGASGAELATGTAEAGLTTATEAGTTAAGDTATTSAASLAARLPQGAASSLAFQGFNSAGQMASTAIETLPEGGPFSAAGRADMAAAGKDQLFYLAASPLAGAVSGGLPNSILLQAPTDLATNVGLTYGDDEAVHGHGMTRDDWIQAVGMTLPGTAQRMSGHPESRWADPAAVAATGSAAGAPPDRPRGPSASPASPDGGQPPDPNRPVRVFVAGSDGVEVQTPGQAPAGRTFVAGPAGIEVQTPGQAPAGRTFVAGPDGIEVQTPGQALAGRRFVAGPDGIVVQTRKPGGQAVQGASGATRPLPAQSAGSRRSVTLEQSVAQLMADGNEALTSAAGKVQRGGRLVVRTTDDISSKADQAAIRQRLEAKGFTNVRFRERSDNGKINRRNGLARPKATDGFNLVTARKPRVDDWRISVTARLRAPIPEVPFRPADSDVVSGPNVASRARGRGSKSKFRTTIISDRLLDVASTPRLSWLVGWSHQEAYQIDGTAFVKAAQDTFEGNGDDAPFNVEMLGARKIGTRKDSAGNDHPVVELAVSFSPKASEPFTLREGKSDRFDARGPARQLTRGLPVTKAMSETKVSVAYMLKAALQAVAARHGIHLPPVLDIALSARGGLEQRPETTVDPQTFDAATVNEKFYQQVNEPVRRVTVKMQVVAHDKNYAAKPLRYRDFIEGTGAQQKRMTLDQIRSEFSSDPSDVRIYIPAGWRSGLRRSVVDNKAPTVTFTDLTGQNITAWNPEVAKFDIVFDTRRSPDFWIWDRPSYAVRRNLIRLPPAQWAREHSAMGRRLVTAAPRYQSGGSFFKREVEASGKSAERATVRVSLLAILSKTLGGHIPEPLRRIAVDVVATLADEIRGQRKTTEKVAIDEGADRNAAP